MDRDAIPFNDRVVSFRHCHNGAETQFPLVVVDGSWKVEDWELRRNPVENWHVRDCATKLTPFSNGFVSPDGVAFTNVCEHAPAASSSKVAFSSITKAYGASALLMDENAV